MCKVRLESRWGHFFHKRKCYLCLPTHRHHFNHGWKAGKLCGGDKGSPGPNSVWWGNLRWTEMTAGDISWIFFLCSPKKEVWVSKLIVMMTSPKRFLGIWPVGVPLSVGAPGVRRSSVPAPFLPDFVTCHLTDCKCLHLWDGKSVIYLIGLLHVVYMCK